MPSSAPALSGTCKRWFTDRGFGFLAVDGDDGKDLFVHLNDISDGGQLQPGDRVQFRRVIKDGKPRAIGVRVL